MAKRILRCPTRKRLWRIGEGCGSTRLAVGQRLCNHSAFNGYRWTPSKYSAVHCLDCGRVWRTKADVSHLPDRQLGIAGCN